MAQNKLILRKLSSPYTGFFADSTKGSVLSHAELDGNQIYLKGEIIYTATTSGTTLTLKKINGNDINVVIDASVTATTDTYTTGTTVSGNTIQFNRTDLLNAYDVDLSSMFSGITASILYTNPEAMPVDVGGWEEGSSFSALTMQEMWDGLLYPYQFPEFTAFNRTSLDSEYEIGEQISVGSNDFSWTLDNIANVDDLIPDSLKIVERYTGLDSGISETTIGDSLSKVTPETIVTTNAIGFTTTGARNIYKIYAKNSRGTEITDLISKTWKVNWYYGKTLSTSMTASEMTGLTSNLVTSVVNSYVVMPETGTPEYPFLCIPDFLTQPSDLRDATTGCFGNNHPFNQLGDITINNQFGVSVTYNVYRFVNAIAGGGGTNVYLCN